MAEEEEKSLHSHDIIRHDERLGWVVESNYYGRYEIAYVGTYEECISYIGKDVKHE